MFENVLVSCIVSIIRLRLQRVANQWFVPCTTPSESMGFNRRRLKGVFSRDTSGMSRVARHAQPSRPQGRTL